MKLYRREQTDRETLGHLCTDEERLVCVTLERPRLDNRPMVSCIPAGTYTCRRRHSPHFNCDVFQIMDVPGRDFIEIHPANYVHELEGCVGLGRSFADLDGDGVMDVESSRVAFDKFMREMAGTDSFELEVLDPDASQAAAA